jgi:hypothetical protein
MLLIENDLRYSCCPLCASKAILCQGTLKFTTPAYYSTTKIQLKKYSELWSCDKCQSSFIQNAVLEQDVIKLYSQGASEERWTTKPFEQSKTETVISELKVLLEDGFSVLDVGCDSGNFGSPGIPVVKPTSSVLGCPRTME